MLGFLRSLADCMQDVAPAMRACLGGVYDRLTVDADAPNFLAEWAASHLASISATIVVDELAGGVCPQLDSLLALLIAQTMPRLRWIVLLGSSDAFPVARWLADNLVDIPLGEEDLRVRRDELAATVACARQPFALDRLDAGRDASPERLNLVLDAAVSGVQLDQLGAANDDALFGLFMGARTPSERELLAQTSFFRCFDDVLLERSNRDEAVAARSIFQSMSSMRRDRAGVYRYDPLFHRELQRWVHDLGMGTYLRYAQRAATALIGVGRTGEALAIAIAALGADDLSALVASHGLNLLTSGEGDVVERALARFDDVTLERHATVLAVKAAVEARRGHIDTAEAWYRLSIDRAIDLETRKRIVRLYAIDLGRRNRPDLIETLEPYTGDAADGASSAQLLGSLAAAYAADQQPAKARRTADRALGALERITDMTVHAEICHHAAFAAFYARDFERARHFAQRAVTTALAHYMYDVAARSLSILYNIAIEHDDDTPAARLHLDSMTECGLKSGSKPLELYAALARYEIEVTAGNLGAIALLDRKLRSLEIYYSPMTAETLLTAQALRAPWKGDFYEAYLLLAHSAQNQTEQDRRAHRWSEVAVYAAAAALHEEAAQAIDESLTLLRTAPSNDTFAQRTKAFLALASTLIGRRGRAARLLAELRRSPGCRVERMDAMVRAVDVVAQRWSHGTKGPSMREVLDRLERCDLGGLARMIEAIAIPESHVAQFAQLTGTERSVLRHLAAGMTSKEIAALGRGGAKSVDAHVKSICRKLHCTGRRHAVAIAVKEGLLQSGRSGLGNRAL
jgi:ATP/maltotriose-dependent transcriptional regulator MalT